MILFQFGDVGSNLYLDETVIISPSPTQPFLCLLIFFVFFHFFHLIDSTFLKKLTFPNIKFFRKSLKVYKISSFFKEISNSSGTNPDAPIMIGKIYVSLSHILASSSHNSEKLSNFLFVFSIRLLSTGHAASIIYFFVVFSITTISGL